MYFKSAATGGCKIPLHPTGEDRDQLPRNGFVLDAALQIRDQRKHLRIVQHDVSSGAIGTLTIPPTGSLREKATRNVVLDQTTDY